MGLGLFSTFWKLGWGYTSILLVQTIYLVSVSFLESLALQSVNICKGQRTHHIFVLDHLLLLDFHLYWTKIWFQSNEVTPLCWVEEFGGRSKKKHGHEVAGTQNGFIWVDQLHERGSPRWQTFQSQWGRVPSHKGKKSRELLGEWGNGERPYCPGDAMSLSCKMGSLWVRELWRAAEAWDLL